MLQRILRNPLVAFTVAAVVVAVPLAAQDATSPRDDALHAWYTLELGVGVTKDLGNAGSGWLEVSGNSTLSAAASLQFQRRAVWWGGRWRKDALGIHGGGARTAELFAGLGTRRDRLNYRGSVGLASVATKTYKPSTNHEMVTTSGLGVTTTGFADLHINKDFGMGLEVHRVFADRPIFGGALVFEVLLR